MIYILCFSFLFTSIALISLYRIRRFISKAKLIKGTISSVNKISNYSNETNSSTINYQPVYSFVFNNTKHSQKSNMQYSSQKKVAIGKTVSLYILKKSNNEFSVKENNWLSLYLIPLILGFFAFCLFLTFLITQQ